MTIEKFTLEDIADRYYQRNRHTQQERGAQGPKREAEQSLTHERFQKGCGCSLNSFTVEEVADARLALNAPSKVERDMLLLGKLQTYEPPREGSTHPRPKRACLTYAERYVKATFALFMDW